MGKGPRKTVQLIRVPEMTSGDMSRHEVEQPLEQLAVPKSFRSSPARAKKGKSFMSKDRNNTLQVLKNEDLNIKDSDDESKGDSSIPL